MRRGGPALAFLGGAIAWSALTALWLSFTNTGMWRWRDDAVITLSHARNLVEFGSIGVNPIGERAEGFSAPLQFLVSTLGFLVGPKEYGPLLDVFTWAGVSVSGGLVALIAYAVATDAGMRHKELVAASAALVAGVIALSSWTTTGWLMSGMENPFVLVLMLAVAAAVGLRANTVKLVLLGTGIALLGMTRIEMPLMLAPLVVVLVVITRTRDGFSWRRSVGWVAGISLGVWVLMTVARFAYFGHLLPNTALVQGKGTSLASVAILIVATIGSVVLAWSVARPPTRGTAVAWAVIAAALLALLGLLMVRADTTGAMFFGYWYPDPGYAPILLVAAALAAIQALAAWRTAPPAAVEPVLLVLALLPLAQYATMGPARLDAFRIASLSIPIMATWIGVVAIRVVGTRQAIPARRAALVVVGSVVLGVVLVAAVVALDGPRQLCCTITPAEQEILAEAAVVQDGHLGGQALPIVAAPDLGKLSFAKSAVIVDLGWLGDPVLARIHRGTPDLEAQYLQEVAAPDVVEMHGGWPCMHAAWFESTAFARTYAPAGQAPTGLAMACMDAASDVRTIYLRHDNDTEYQLTAGLLTSTDPVADVREAITACASSGDDSFRCEHVRRALTRAAVELRKTDAWPGILDAVADSPSADLDLPLLAHPRAWDAQAYDAFVRLARG